MTVWRPLKVLDSLWPRGHLRPKFFMVRINAKFNSKNKKLSKFFDRTNSFVINDDQNREEELNSLYYAVKTSTFTIRHGLEVEHWATMQ